MDKSYLIRIKIAEYDGYTWKIIHDKEMMSSENIKSEKMLPESVRLAIINELLKD